MIAFISTWDTSAKIVEFINNIKINSNISRIVILAQHEWEYTKFVSSKTAFEEIIDIKNNLPIDIITGCHLSSPLSHNTNNPRYKNITLHYWPTFWMSCFSRYDKDRHIANGPIDKLFCLLNGNAHYHRCRTMDLLCRDNLLDKGYVSWYDFNFPAGYTFKHWNPTKLTLDTFNNASNLFTVPPEFGRAFVNLVSESNMTPYFLTEKTTKPLYYKKPFLVVSKEGFHTKFLTEFGFKLYDEIFDYSFDLIADQDERIEAVVQEIKRFENHSNSQLQELTTQIENKLEFNQKHLMSLMYDVNIWPKVITELLGNEYFQDDNNLPDMYDYCKKIKENL